MASHLDRLRHLDLVSRIAVINLTIVFSYIILICIIIPAANWGSGKGFNDYIFAFSDPGTAHLNLISIIIAIVIGSVVALLTRPLPPGECAQKKGLMKDLLSADEQRIVDVVTESEEITQDSLTFRLGWSRAKVSTLITNLERMNVIQRRRTGKTYTIFPARHR